MSLRIHFNGNSQYREGEVIGPALWPHHDLILITGGAVRFTAGGSEFLVKDGDGLLIPPGNHFEGTPVTEEADVRAIHFSGYRSPFSVSGWKRHHHPYLADGLLRPPPLRQYGIRLHELGLDETLPTSVERSALLEVLLAALEQGWIDAPAHPPARERIDALLAWAEEEFSGGVQVSDLAARANLSESHFRALFKAIYGVTPLRALREIRLREARRLLRDTPYSIAEISGMVGYGDVVAFHRAFRRGGETPAAYRAAQRGKI
jgi:AraC-like DNA-binding protein